MPYLTFALTQDIATQEIVQTTIQPVVTSNQAIRIQRAFAWMNLSGGNTTQQITPFISARSKLVDWAAGISDHSVLADRNVVGCIQTKQSENTAGVVGNYVP